MKDCVIVSNASRQICDFIEFYFIFIPLSEDEILKLGNLDGMINPCWRIRIMKNKLEE